MRTAIMRQELSQETWTPSLPTHLPSTVPLDSAILDGLQPSALSVDVTNLCNLRCKHCFWDSYDEALPAGTNELILDSVKAVLKKYPSITNITWYGGEPLINHKTIEVVEQGLTLKKNNLIMTNGTFPIPDWRTNVHFGVSLDGTRTIHDTLRGVNAYNRSKKNILSAIAKGVSVGILYCLNAINIDCVADFLEEWAEVKPIVIGFTVYTPLIGKPSYLNLSDRQREKIVSLLARMKKKYGKLIYNTEAMIELIHVKYGEELAQHCPMNVLHRQRKVYSLHMCNNGTIRFPCALGENADHVHCRSITKVALYAAKILRDKDSLRALLRMYHSKPHYREKNSLHDFLI